MTGSQQFCGTSLAAGRNFQASRAFRSKKLRHFLDREAFKNLCRSLQTPTVTIPKRGHDSLWRSPLTRSERAVLAAYRLVATDFGSPWQPDEWIVVPKSIAEKVACEGESRFSPSCSQRSSSSRSSERAAVEYPGPEPKHLRVITFLTLSFLAVLPQIGI